MEAMISAIMQANEDEIEKILRAAIRRKRELYPDWEITYEVRQKRPKASLLGELARREP